MPRPLLPAGGPARHRREGGGLTALPTAEVVALDGAGLGLAERDGEALRVPLTAPGDRLALHGGTPRVTHANEAVRQAPPCPHFGECGGCALQHLSDPFVAAWKRERVLGALSGQRLEAEVRDTRTVPAGDRRRVKLAVQRTKRGALVGFRARGEERVVPIRTCHIADPAIVAALPALASLAIGAARKRALGVSVTASERGLDVAVEGGKALDLDLRQRLATLAEEADLARLTWGAEPVATRRPPIQRFGKAAVVPPPGAFLQASPTGEAWLRERVLAETEGAARVADLFAGCGTFALPLAQRATLAAFEADAAMVAALEAGWRGGDGMRPLTAEARDLFRRPLDADELKGFDAVVLNPPRAGAKAQAAALAASAVPRVVMVSCDPATFARDARLLREGGYRMGEVTVIDQFRWSPHVEVVAGFGR